jgi:hypothetical protein
MDLGFTMKLKSLNFEKKLTTKITSSPILNIKIKYQKFITDFLGLFSL